MAAAVALVAAVAAEATAATVATSQVASWQLQGGNDVVVVMMSAVATVASMEANQQKMHRCHQLDAVCLCPPGHIDLIWKILLNFCMTHFPVIKPINPQVMKKKFTRRNHDDSTTIMLIIVIIKSAQKSSEFAGPRKMHHLSHVKQHNAFCWSSEVRKMMVFLFHMVKMLKQQGKTTQAKKRNSHG